MSFLDINGLAVNVAYGSFQRNTADVETFGRTEGHTYEGVLYAAKRQWSFEVPYDLTEAVTISNEGWLKGRGHYWTFDRVDGATTRFNRFSTDGGPGLTAAQLTNVATPKFGTWGGEVTGSLASTVTVTFGSEGRYSVSVWRRERSGAASGIYRLCSTVANGITTTSYLGSEATSAFSTFLALSAASGILSVQLKGVTESGASMPIVYDGLMIVPYALSTTQLAARNARTSAEPNFPYVEFDGDICEDVLPIVVKCFVKDHEITQAQSGGTTNVRALSVEMIEK